MQDFMYRNASGYEVLIEMSCCKYPREGLLRGLWEENRDPLINFLLQAHIGEWKKKGGGGALHTDLA